MKRREEILEKIAETAKKIFDEDGQLVVRLYVEDQDMQVEAEMTKEQEELYDLLQELDLLLLN